MGNDVHEVWVAFLILLRLRGLVCPAALGDL
jgi:hypothetical protein